MDLGLRGKVALVAAASKGIGRAIAQGLIEEGASVSICGRTQSNLDAALDELGSKAKGYICNVTQAHELESWVTGSQKDLGPIDVLVTNTGGPPAGSWTEKTDQEWQSGVDSTLMNVVRLVRLVHPQMKEREWGRIVHVTSLVAKEPSAVLPISSTLRAGIAALTRLQSDELAPHGITVNGILPGHTLTDRQLHLAEINAKRWNVTPEEALKRAGDEVPVGRLARVQEIADAAVFLCSERASYVTGVNLLVDGGLTRTPG